MMYSECNMSFMDRHLHNYVLHNICRYNIPTHTHTHLDNLYACPNVEKNIIILCIMYIQIMYVNYI